MNRNPILPFQSASSLNYGACSRRRLLDPIVEGVESNFTNESRSTNQSIYTIDDSDESSRFSVVDDSVNELDLSISALKKVMLFAIPSVLLFVLGMYTHAAKAEKNEALSIDVAEVFGTLRPTYTAAHLLDRWLSSFLD